MPLKLSVTVCMASGGPITQGSFIRICFDPGTQGTNDGYRMREINSFKYTKIGSDGEVIAQQEAVVESSQASNGFTKLTCEQGSVQCTTETLLLANFYDYSGPVGASGQATMQFGDQNSDEDRRRSRRLQEGVQEDFEVVFQVIASSQEGQDVNRVPRIDEPNTGIGAAGIGIIVLLVLDISTIFVLVFQHSFFKGMWFYL